MQVIKVGGYKVLQYTLVKADPQVSWSKSIFLYLSIYLLIFSLVTYNCYCNAQALTDWLGLPRRLVVNYPCCLFL